MKRYFGICVREDGSYVSAAVRTDAGSGPSVRITNRPSVGIVERMRMLDREITLGVPCSWRSGEPAGELPDDCMRAEETKGRWYAVAHESEVRLHEEALEDNLAGIVPDDAATASIPKAFDPECPADFVALQQHRDSYRIGVIAGGVLEAVQRFSPADSAKLESCLGRLRRYRETHLPDAAFPRVLYVVGDPVSVGASPAGLTPRHVPVPGCEGDSDAVRACGVALAREYGVTPLFRGPTEAWHFRRVRAGAYMISAGLVLLAAASLLGVLGARWYYSRARARHEAHYARVISNNRDVKEAIDANTSLARTVLRLRSHLTHQTSWGRLLDLLARRKPGGLYLEKLISASPEKGSTRIRIGLNGWAANEKEVTAFIGRLQQAPFLTDVKLESLTRSGTGARRADFELRCTLHLKGT